MIGVYAEDDRKMKEVMKSTGNVAYRACDENARDRIEQAEASGRLSIKEDNLIDLNRTTLIDQIINIIAKETMNNRVARQLQLLNEIHSCKRITGETPAEF